MTTNTDTAAADENAAWQDQAEDAALRTEFQTLEDAAASALEVIAAKDRHIARLQGELDRARESAVNHYWAAERDRRLVAILLDPEMPRAQRCIPGEQTQPEIVVEAELLVARGVTPEDAVKALGRDAHALESTCRRYKRFGLAVDFARVARAAKAVQP